MASVVLVMEQNMTKGRRVSHFKNSILKSNSDIG